MLEISIEEVVQVTHRTILPLVHPESAAKVRFQPKVHIRLRSGSAEREYFRWCDPREIGGFEETSHIAGTLLPMEEAIQSHFDHLGTPSIMAVGVEQEQGNVGLPVDSRNQHDGIYKRIGLLVPALNVPITTYNLNQKAYRG